MRKYRARDFWSRLLKKNEEDLCKLFSNSLSSADKKYIFKQFVETVHLELSTKCNRHCSYCPLSFDNRGIIQNHMSDLIIDKVIDELVEIKFDNTVILNLYNEPLLDENLEKNVLKIKSALPDSFILFHSNGDYLTKKRLLGLQECGVGEIRVTLHSNKYDDTDRKQAIQKFFDKIGLDYEISKFVSNREIVVERQLDALNLIVKCVNLAEIGNNRTGTVKNIAHKTQNRINPCMKPFREIVISAEGDFFPCCNFFPNSDKAKKHILGNVAKQSVIDAFSSDILVKFRNNLFDFSNKMDPCNSCNDEDNALVDSDARRKEILSKCKSFLN